MSYSYDYNRKCNKNTVVFGRAKDSGYSKPNTCIKNTCIKNLDQPSNIKNIRNLLQSSLLIKDHQFKNFSQRHYQKLEVRKEIKEKEKQRILKGQYKPSKLQLSMCNPIFICTQRQLQQPA